MDSISINTKDSIVTKCQMDLDSISLPSSARDAQQESINQAADKIQALQQNFDVQS